MLRKFVLALACILAGIWLISQSAPRLKKPKYINMSLGEFANRYHFHP